MPDYDAGFKIVAHRAGRQLAALAGVQCQHWQPIGGEVQATERLADRAFRARGDGERFIVYMEAYTRWQAAAPWSILSKSGLLSERERLPTVSLVYILLPRGYRPQHGTFQLAVDGAATQRIWFREICLWQLDPQGWETEPGLMALYPLSRHGRSPTEAVSHAAQAISAAENDKVVRADLLTTLGLFGKLVNPGIDLFHLIGREQMKESKFYQEIMDEGRLEGRREYILEAIQVRFGTEAASSIAGALGPINDSDRLSELHRLAMRCRRLSEFQRAVTATGE